MFKYNQTLRHLILCIRNKISGNPFGIYRRDHALWAWFTGKHRRKKRGFLFYPPLSGVNKSHGLWPWLFTVAGKPLLNPSHHFLFFVPVMLVAKKNPAIFF